jgi:hypothetical protein
MERILAQSKNYTIFHHYEIVSLNRPSSNPVIIGDFYGDPQAAIIDKHKNWVIIVGCGMILYRLQEPFIPYEYDKKTTQWWDAFRSPPDDWWIKSVYQVADTKVRFVVDPWSAHAGVYELDMESLSVTRLIPKDEKKS